MSDQHITFVVGAEKRLKDILAGADVLPLLKAAVKAGAAGAAVSDDRGNTLWEHRGGAAAGGETTSLPILLEGEPVGHILVEGGREYGDYSRGIAGILLETLTAVLNANLKRMLATEVHTSVVNLSHEELLETNARLRASEARYRELAENLEKKVIERTEELKQAHARLLQQEKMASIGQLAAGMAHEINNPLGFITSNLGALNKYLARLREMIAFYETGLGSAAAPDKLRKEASDKKRELKIDFILSDAGELISQSLSGAERMKKLVSDLKGFSHIDEAEEMPMDLNEELDKTLGVLGREFGPSAKIIRDFRPLPLFPGKPALLCQVFLNLILNALQARKDGLELTISTRSGNGAVAVRIADNGPGIPAEIRQRIFDPFFTTKDVGSGTGMGLTVAYDVVTSCGGTIRLDDTETGAGASFTITLPISKR